MQLFFRVMWKKCQDHDRWWSISSLKGHGVMRLHVKCALKASNLMWIHYSHWTYSIVCPKCILIQILIGGTLFARNLVRNTHGTYLKLGVYRIPAARNKKVVWARGFNFHAGMSDKDTRNHVSALLFQHLWHAGSAGISTSGAFPVFFRGTMQPYKQ